MEEKKIDGLLFFSSLGHLLGTILWTPLFGTRKWFQLV